MATVPENLSARVIEFVRREIPGAAVKLTPETSLLRSGLLDSIAVVRLAAFIERETGLVIPDRDVTADHFDTVGLILAYIAGRGAR